MQPFFTLKITLTDNTEVDMTDKHTFDEAKAAIAEMRDEGVFTLPLLSPVTFIPWASVAKIELILST